MLSLVYSDILNAFLPPPTPNSFTLITFHFVVSLYQVGDGALKNTLHNICLPQNEANITYNFSNKNSSKMTIAADPLNLNEAQICFLFYSLTWCWKPSIQHSQSAANIRKVQSSCLGRITKFIKFRAGINILFSLKKLWSLVLNIQSQEVPSITYFCISV